MVKYNSGSIRSAHPARAGLAKKGGKRNQPQDTDRGSRGGIGSSKD